MKSQPVRFINRYTGAVETEPVPGAGWLRWLYWTGAGQMTLHALVKRSLLSRWYGWRMDRPSSRARIAPFVAEYGIDMSQFSLPTTAYLTFNHFFHRSLAGGARPIDPGEHSIVFPADGRHLAFENVDARQHRSRIPQNSGRSACNRETRSLTLSEPSFLTESRA